MKRLQRRNLIVVDGLGSILAVMTTLVAYSVPLHRLFCAATGCAGTRRVVADSAQVSQHVVTVRFDTQVADRLHWQFEPVQPEVKVHLGYEKLVFFRAKNLTDHALVAHATFNVTPVKAGFYLNNIQCFCFNHERLEAGESVRMPVDFFVAPALAEDANAADVDTITPSHTLFLATTPKEPEDRSRFEHDAPPDAERVLVSSPRGVRHAMP